MAFLYIVLGLICLMAAIFFLYKKDQMKHQIQDLKNQSQAIDELNEQLDEIYNELNQMNEPLMKVHSISSKILEYKK